MQIRKSGAKYSAIVGIGEKIRKQSLETSEEYLLLNRGVNAVCHIELDSIIKDIDFNSNDMQVYPPSQGRQELRQAINNHYFNNKTSLSNISVSGGGMSALDLVFQTLDVDQIILPEFYWGSYFQVMTIRDIESGTYTDFDNLLNRLDEIKNSAVIICDPNNPIGNKVDDENLLKTIKLLNDNGTTVIVDCPYRRIFCDQEDTFFQNLLDFENVIIVESFSKSIGLSGQRLGFIHSTNTDFNTELGIRLMYATNGINAFSQILVTQILMSEKGKQSRKQFKETTVKGIRQNIEYLNKKGLLASEFYKEGKAIGIFVVVNKSEEELLEKKIGSVSLSYFTKTKKNEAAKYARICVSVPSDKFESYFKKF
ncbi:pyridoxal phosphate-dependent aminotransferase [Ancylomarina sp. 16SWW S1-10-2]|uniref:pyridoxal phosphate-dependent aminotransferase n=1 Tax=Ancylomarina sp. 16SWW S1-10-2 TaxID=2499681 RepID=UPI0012AE8984|nr:pyridoxal phosphate-dependent aminotransferase [Ancylomarina sp. 16SWW S1-10-2]MRT91743.1 pyridoxal phosphate-dependent aminotransferase [Ancylomarina sp. 16SWW S1-10-2]